MKPFLTLFAFAISVSLVLAQPPKGPVTPGTTFGDKVIVAGAVPAASLPTLLKNNEARQLKVEGIVTEVCDKKGCWVFRFHQKPCR